MIQHAHTVHFCIQRPTPDGGYEWLQPAQVVRVPVAGDLVRHPRLPGWPIRVGMVEHVLGPDPKIVVYLNWPVNIRPDRLAELRKPWDPDGVVESRWTPRDFAAYLLYMVETHDYVSLWQSIGSTAYDSQAYCWRDFVGSTEADLRVYYDRVDNDLEILNDVTPKSAGSDDESSTTTS